MKRPSITFQPRSGKYLLRGVSALAELIRPTIGPTFRMVASEQIAGRNRPPELLSDGATLARRIIQLSNDPADVGAMLLRQAVWQVGERAGDGTATTAVLAHAIIKEAYKRIAAGANAMRIRVGIERAVDAAAQSLREQSTPISTQRDLTRIADSLCHDPELARYLGEAFNIIGADGFVEVQTSRGRKIEREYVEGACWRSSVGYFSRNFAENTTTPRITMQDAAVVLIDGKLNDVDVAGKIFTRLLQAGRKDIFLVCRDISEAVLSVMTVNHRKGNIKFLPVKMPVLESDKLAMFEDIAALTGATVFYLGETKDVSLFTAEMAGGVRRAWADATQFGLIGGRGDPRALREHIKTLRASMTQAKDKDKTEEQRVMAVRQRIARLMGGICVLSIGAPTEAEQKARQQMAERCVRAMYAIVRGGVAPGGGAAFLACQTAVRKLAFDEPDVQAGVECVARALESLMRAIARNAGHHPSTIVARARLAGKGFGLDAVSGEIVNMREAGIVDSTEVLEQVLRAAGSVAATTVTTDVVYRRKKPQEAVQP